MSSFFNKLSNRVNAAKASSGFSSTPTSSTSGFSSTPTSSTSSFSSTPTSSTSSGQVTTIDNGNIPFFVFYCIVLARMAYLDPDVFIEKYCLIFGPVIPNYVLQRISMVALENYSDLLDDAKLFNFKNPGAPLSLPEYRSADGKRLDFTKLKHILLVLFKEYFKNVALLTIWVTRYL